MPTLLQSLRKYDLSHLRIIAQLWGVELLAKESREAREELSDTLLSQELILEIVESLPTDARNALDALIQNKGRLSWEVFTRQFGKIREVGAGHRDREKVHLNPISAAEILYYRAFLARAFFDTPKGAQEFAYLPDDLVEHIAVGEQHTAPPQPLGHLARPNERAHIILANDHLLDDMTTLIASLRLGWDKPPYPLDTSLRFARDLLPAARLISPSPVGRGAKGEGKGLQTDSVKAFLETPRAEMMVQLTESWRESKDFNELRQISGIICEGEWEYSPLKTREAILSFLEIIPRDKWWNLNSFIVAVKEQHPDFQRTGGDYDAWFIRRAKDNELLQGFAYWDEVEGALIRYFIIGALHWLGLVDLASAKEDGEIKAFRVREKAIEKEGSEKINISSNGLITIPRYTSRVARYIIARFCRWEESKNPDEYRYQITPSALEEAREQGLNISHLIGALQKYTSSKIPPTLARALRRWEVSGTEARVETLSILRLSKPEDLRALRESKAGRFLGDVLGPTAVVVKAGASQKIMAALIEMGIFMKDEK